MSDDSSSGWLDASSVSPDGSCNTPFRMAATSERPLGGFATVGALSKISRLWRSVPFDLRFVRSESSKGTLAILKWRRPWRL